MGNIRVSLRIEAHTWDRSKAAVDKEAVLKFIYMRDDFSYIGILILYAVEERESALERLLQLLSYSLIVAWTIGVLWLEDELELENLRPSPFPPPW